jgi:4-hydroxy-tetrahydrodipicolinate reductase
MELAIIGYGRMGHEIENIALQRGHSVRLIIDVDNTSDLNRKNLAGIDVAIEFSLPSTSFKNISTCLSNTTPVVSGTTGWQIDLEKISELCATNKTSFLHASNFSIGVNLLFRLNTELAKQMNKYNEYTVSIEEAHHIKKLDAPSGTAISLAKGIINEHDRYSSWNKGKNAGSGSIPVESIREGDVPGIHTVKWSSDIDTISLIHDSKSRKGFAFGAVIAAEFIAKRQGVFTMEDVMGF